MKAEIINVGTELTSGDTLNINSQYLSRRLLELGIDVRVHVSVEDNRDLLKELIGQARNRADIIVFTGGLGPTDDDFTKEVVAEVAERELVYNQKTMDDIEAFFAKRGLAPTENNRKQAYEIAGGVTLRNELGTAPGYYLEDGATTYILLPGPPGEMNYMFEHKVAGRLKSDENIYVKMIRTVGIGESQLEESVKDMIREDNEVYVATYAKLGEVRVKLTSRDETRLSEVYEEIEKRLGDYIYAIGYDSLEMAIFKNLRANGLRVGFCESCTGGLVASSLAAIPGASDVLDRSVVTYSNSAKVEEVGVSRESLEKYGAVSEQVAKEMAEGLFKKADIDIAVSVTGVAGPEETEEKPVGLVYLGITTKEGTLVEKHLFPGRRKTVQERSAKEALNMMRKHMINRGIYRAEL